MTRVRAVVLNGFMTKETLTTQTARHWENDNGQAVCSAHAGNYLTTAVEQYPKRKKHVTPLGTWYEMPADEVAYMTETYGGACETCVFGKGY